MSVLCEKCGKRKADFFYQETKNGVKKELHLCHGCAKEMGFGSDEILLPFPMFSAFGHRKDPVEKRCPLCGTSLSAIRKKGKFGCSECYDTFKNDLDLTPFVGAGYREENEKEGEKIPAEKKEASPLEKMKKELKEALEKEEYEKAAILRDQIRAEEGKQ